jgi:hypothetical protein
MSDSGTGSESEKEEALEKMTKEQLYLHMMRSKCIMMAGRNIRHMTKDQMVEYLMKCKCPVLMRLISPAKKHIKK